MITRSSINDHKIIRKTTSASTETEEGKFRGNRGTIAAKQQHGQWQDLGLSPSGRGPQNDYFDDFDGKVDDQPWLLLVVSLMNFGAPPMWKTHVASPSVPPPGVPRPWDLRHVLWSEMRVMGISKIGGLWSLAASELAWNMLEWNWYGIDMDDGLMIGRSCQYLSILSMIFDDLWWSLKSLNFLIFLWDGSTWVHLAPCFIGPIGSSPVPPTPKRGLRQITRDLWCSTGDRVIFFPSNSGDTMWDPKTLKKDTSLLLSSSTSALNHL